MPKLKVVLENNTLGELIEGLKLVRTSEEIGKARVVVAPDHNLEKHESYEEELPCSFISWRGNYFSLALLTSGLVIPNLDKLIELTVTQIGSTHEGYKGGEFVMFEDSEVYTTSCSSSSLSTYINAMYWDEVTNTVYLQTRILSS